MADHLLKAHGLSASRSEMLRFCRKFGRRLYRPRYRFLRGNSVKQAETGELVLLSRDEARFPMIPTPLTRSIRSNLCY